MSCVQAPRSAVMISACIDEEEEDNVADFSSLSTLLTCFPGYLLGSVMGVGGLNEAKNVLWKLAW